MVAINKIPLPESNGEGCGGDTDVCTDGRVHRNAENRAPTTRNRCRGVALGRWLTRDPIGYRSGINLYGYVNSSPVGSVDAGGRVRKALCEAAPAEAVVGGLRPELPDSGQLLCPSHRPRKRCRDL